MGFVMSKNFFLVWFVVLLVLAANVSALYLSAQSIYFQGSDNEGFLPESARITVKELEEEGFTCRLGGQTPEESQNILDLLNDGFVGENISSGEKPPEKREFLDNNNIFVPVDDKTAVKTEVASAKIQPRELQHLVGDSFLGPFAFGLVLDDTVRIGKCEGLEDKNLPCPVTEKSLQLRNDGEGIVSDFRSAKKALVDAVPWLKDKSMKELSDKEFEVLRKDLGLKDANKTEFEDTIALMDENNDKIIQFKRKVSSIIPNSILSTSFDALSRTDCSSSECSISLYSLFDKYYNSLFTAEMVVSTGFPTLFYRAQKLFKFLSIKKIAPWSLTESKFVNSLRARYANPNSWLGQRRVNAVKQAGYKFPGIAELKSELFENKGWTSGYGLVKGGAFRRFWTDKAVAKGGLLDQAAKDPKLQEELFSFVKNIRGFTKAQRALYFSSSADYDKVLTKYGYGSAQEVAARIDHARDVAGLMKNWDDAFDLDMLELFSRDYSPGLYPYFVQTPDGTFQWLAGDSIYIRSIIKKFQRDGHWGGSWGSVADQAIKTKGRNVVFYQPKATEKIADIGPGDLDTLMSKYKEKFIELDTGTILPINEMTIPFIKENITGPAAVYDTVWAPTFELTPEDFATRLLNQRNILTNFIMSNKNADIMYNSLVDRGFARRNYFNLLDRAMTRQQELLKDYFSLRGGLKWTAYTYAFWWGKRAEIPGVGFLEGDLSKKLSAYQLPEEWIQIMWPLGNTDLYNDAFIEFFANTGSDDGDILRRFLNALPWDSLVYRNITKAFGVAEKQYEAMTGRGKRTTVKNLGFYSSSGEDCTNCSVSFTEGNRLNSFGLTFYSDNETKNFVVEDSKPEKDGSLLIAFSRHTDIAGREKSKTGNTAVNLQEAIEKKDTCQNKVVEAVAGIPFLKESLKESPAAIGGLLAFGETLGYFVFGWSGLFGSIAQQVWLVPKFQDCVDVSGGYFTHIFAPPKPKKSRLSSLFGTINLGEDTTQQAAKSVSSTFSGIQKNFEAVLSGDSNTPIGQGLETVKKQTEDFFESVDKQPIVEAVIRTKGFSSGSFESTRLFTFWFKGETSPKKYKETGRKQLNAKDQNFSLELNFEKGVLNKVDGKGDKKTILDNNDVVRLSSTNTDIPAEELPKRITYLGLPNKKLLLFEAGLDSKLVVKNKKVMDCLRQAVLDQTGVPLTATDRVTQAFGLLKEISTDSHPTIKIFGKTNRIVAEGSPRRFVEGPTSKILVYANRETELSNHKKKPVGLLNSIILENGAMVFKPKTRELVVWLKKNSRAILEQTDVTGINLTKTNSKNPKTNCSEPAVSLNVIPRQGSDFINLKAENFNNSLATMGPFQVFETPTKRFSFYSKQENGSCQDYFKVYNKQTGESYEAPIDSMTVTPDGIKVIDGNGREHNLVFSAQDGIPRISYNNQPQETLTSVQGRNGAFWFDPATGRWYTENASLLPLIEAFRKGSLTQTGIGDVVISGPGGNVFNIGTGQQGAGALNLPSLPENQLELFFYLTLLFFAIALLKQKILGKQKHKQN